MHTFAVDYGVVSPALKPGVLKRAIGIGGTAASLIALAFLLKRGLELSTSLGDRLTRISPSGFCIALLAYILGALLLALAWVVLVRMVSGRQVPARPLLIAHLRSQLAKYLPGNVFHLAYRHIAARRQDVGHAALGGALALESVLLIGAAAVLALGVVADPRIDVLVAWAHRLVWVAPALAGFVMLAIIISVARSGIANASARQSGAALTKVLLLDLLFFVLAASSLRALCILPDTLPFGAWCGWLALAWALGYITPGAPAGLGLREAVLALGLSPQLGEAEALALALSYRMLTVTADATLAGLGFAFRDSGEADKLGRE